MDPVTHTLAGVCLGEAFFRDRLGSRAVAVSAIAANLPDIDGIVHATGSASAVLLRRSFGHSLFLLPLWAFGLAWALKRWKYPDLAIPTLLAPIAVGAASHLLLDLINSFGVVLLWPLSEWRPELAIAFIIDLFLTGLLALPLLRRWWPGPFRDGSRIARLALAAAGGYLILCGISRSRAMDMLAREGPADFAYAFPEPLGPHRWRGVLRQGGKYRVYLLRPWSETAELRREIPAAHERVWLARATPLGRKLDWFFKAPVWSVDGNEFLAYDLRFSSLVLERPPVFSFRLRLTAEGAVSLVKDRLL